MSETVSLDVELNSPIARVWHTLTDGAMLSKWMMFEADDFQPVVGHQFQFRMEAGPDHTVIIDCEVLEVDEPHRLSYTWVTGPEHRTTVTWILTESTDGGTRLQFEQSGFRSEAKQEIGGAKSGWTHMLEQLQNLLAG